MAAVSHSFWLWYGGLYHILRGCVTFCGQMNDKILSSFFDVAVAIKSYLMNVTAIFHELWECDYDFLNQKKIDIGLKIFRVF